MLMPAVPPLRILVHCPSFPVVAFGLKSFLMQTFDFDVQSSGEPPLPWHEDSADVIVSEYCEGLCAGRRPGQDRTAPTRVLVVAFEAREREVRAALQRGVTGYVLLGSRVGELSDAVRAVGRGETYLSAAVARCLADAFRREPLTRREWEVLELLAHGACNKGIALQLGISLGTVKAHVKSVMLKLEASTRTQAVRIAVQRGLVDLEAPRARQADRPGRQADAAEEPDSPSGRGRPSQVSWAT